MYMPYKNCKKPKKNFSNLILDSIEAHFVIQPCIYLGKR